MRCFLDIVYMINPSSIIYYKCGMLIYCCTDCSGDMTLSFLSLFVLSCIRSWDLRVELALAANLVLSGRVVPCKLAQQLIVAGV